ncbi:hypothetical protein NKT77_10050 [Moraxella sp. FZLJ2107]|uniref:hypothetical protein n=1 Tax=unclassified Moraxella TaxID=2685852 RepID=UPI0020C8F306|nr:MULTISPECIES: hypothetical protein [unclassified Moraxella]UTO04830.1 hypothetical protein NKT77_10050 [Moraxella sp. FZLJ2107]UTO21564.1 hypothetical protein NKU06_06865 [Moraxella sp. FZLJ2109]UTO21577.1 hypothetical protein NKU06_06930 [Moraxella sp. FZLJ2109]
MATPPVMPPLGVGAMNKSRVTLPIIGAMPPLGNGSIISTAQRLKRCHQLPTAQSSAPSQHCPTAQGLAWHHRPLCHRLAWGNTLAWVQWFGMGAMNKSRVILPIMPTHGNGSITITAHYGAMPTA